MTNKELLINGYLDRISTEFQQSADDIKNRNLAFEILSIAAILDKPFQEVFDQIIIKGDNDGGMDGVWFEDHGEYYDMHVFQCKNKLGLSANEIDKFRNDFRDIFVTNKTNKTNLDGLKPKIDEYRQISEEGIIIETKQYFVFSGQKNDKQYSSNAEIYENYHKPEENFTIIDSDDIYESIANLARKKRKEIRFTFHPEKSNISALDSQALYTYSIQDVRSANFRIKAAELCELMQREIDVNGSIDMLFEENIRAYLGIKVRANKNMHETINKREEAVYFPFLNNGITIICESFTLPKQPQSGMYILPVLNPQIVNGLQTSSVIFDNFRKNQNILDDVYVNIRVYETIERELVTKITDATNTQTPINYRDKISNKHFNIFTKEVFNNAGINYIIKRGEFFNKSSQGYSEAIESDIVLKFWYASFYEEPDVAKNSVSSVLQKIFDATYIKNHPLEALFNGDKDSPIYQQLLVSYKIYRFIQKQKKSFIDKYDFIPYADEILCYGIYKSIGLMFDKYDLESELELAYNESIEAVKEILNVQKEKYVKANKNFSYNGYFKRPLCRIDFNNKKNILENESLIDTLKSMDMTV
jgi:hypothetical protein